ncbi:MAG: tetratricopeptide repeat protein [Candidatus Methanoperedenaceae archaeon]|nr:tetratricopeptide repeat protein [Candidatus Methanoperedenaceae archaeon]
MMAEEGFKRKLAAILSADVKGYSRMMRDDEDSTIRTLTNYRSAISNLIQKFRGHVVDATGDNLLAEFTSVVDAVNCAVEIQRELAERNAELREERKMDFRIGVNLGDVVEEEGRIYGDGVNSAARMESLAEAGGVCISGSVYDSVESKLGLEYEFLGEKEVKNIDKPVRAYRVLSFPGAAAHRVVQAKETLGRKWRKIALSSAVVVVVVVVLGVWQFYMRRPSVEPASVEKMAFPLPEKPSIAVLPFDNMSGDPEQDYIADGFTENIITGLSHIPEMFVIARNSVFTYKGKPVKIKQVSEELGVKYVLEGSVQKTGDRLRVTAQLIDALKGHHLWAERYDRELKDLFKLQDEITIKVVSALQVKLVGRGSGDMVRTENFEAWRHSVKGYRHFDRMTKMGNRKAREHFEQALKLDPDNAYAWMNLAWTHVADALFGFSESPGVSVKRALEIAQKTSERWSASYRHLFMSQIYFVQGQLEKAIAEGEKAVALAPNDPRNHILLAGSLNCAARPEEAIVHAEMAMRLEPYYPTWFLDNVLLPSYAQAGRYEEGLATAEKLLERSLKGEYPPEMAHRFLASSYARLDRMDEARAHAAKSLTIDPSFSVERWRRSPELSLFKDQKWLDRIAEMMRKAGLPD